MFAAAYPLLFTKVEYGFSFCGKTPAAIVVCWKIKKKKDYCWTNHVRHLLPYVAVINYVALSSLPSLCDWTQYTTTDLHPQMYYLKT